MVVGLAGPAANLVLALIGSGVLSVVFFHMPLSVAGCWAIVVLQVLISAFAGMTFPLLWSMFADVADYSELKHGHSSTGLIFSSSSMAQKFGGAFGSALILASLLLVFYPLTDRRMKHIAGELSIRRKTEDHE